MILIALGSNLQSLHGVPARTLSVALERLPAEGVHLRAVSRFYRSPAFPAGSGPDYVNACARVDAPGLSPAQVLAALHRVEADLGRVRETRWQSRGIDLDLIAHGGAVLPDVQTWRHWAGLPLDQQMRAAPDRPVVPHPRLQDRAFVLIPLVEIAPGWRHPVLGQTVAELANTLPEAEKAALVPFGVAFGED